MKKIIRFLIIFLISFIFLPCYSQVQTYKSTSFAYARVYSGKYYWGDWERSNLLITIDLGNDLVKVYSPKIQIYRVYESAGTTYDNSGGTQILFYVIDQDMDRGTLRLRVDSRSSQIYIDFNDCAWVYNVVRI